MRLTAALLLPLLCGSFADAQITRRTVTLELPGVYSFEASVPVFSVATPVSQLASKTLAEWITAAERNFLTQASRLAKDLGTPTAPYAFKASYEVTHDAPHLLSATVEGYEFLGGAHGNPFFKVINIGTVRGTARRLTLADFFKAKSPYKSRVTSALLEKLKTDEGALWVRDGSVTALTDLQLNLFQVHPDGLVFLFGPYEVAPYSSGRFKVKLTAEELGTDFNSGLLGGR